MIDGSQWQLRQTRDTIRENPKGWILSLPLPEALPHVRQRGQSGSYGGLETTPAHLEPPSPEEEVLSRPLWEAGRLRETCWQDTNTFWVAVFALTLALRLTPRMANLVESHEESSASLPSSSVSLLLGTYA